MINIKPSFRFAGFIKKYSICIFILPLSVSIYSQVGINTENPLATLDVVGSYSDIGIPDGIIPPRISGDALKAKDDAYGASHEGTIVYVTSPVTDATTKTAKVTQSNHYYYNGSEWIALNEGPPPFGSSTQGAVKINLNQTDYITLSGSSNYGLLLTNSSVTKAPQYEAGVYPGGITGSPTDIITVASGSEGGKLLEAPIENSGNFFRLNMMYKMIGTAPSTAKYFCVRIESKGSGALVYEESILVPGGLATGAEVQFQVSFSTIADSVSIGEGYYIIFRMDTGASDGLPNNIGIKILDITRINQ